ncbi:MAG TPA: tRNA (N(6)-L-threonylcarbamoyladenosine(37)-C(2))-methylthiotransferase MtaB [Acholeplasmataceae bacterium]|nr:tRNA (N(6)-L-threonylcarbamoyladenosine(37)-C(2))-methylthiotransferase MtaB [Acholeplasmataceae bacterium]
MLQNMKVSYYSLGCKVNLYESEAIINQFLDHGFELANFNDQCDVYIINTCSVTAVSDSKSRKIIRQAIRKNPNAVVAVMGCYAQLKPDDIKNIDGVDVIVGTSNRHLLYPLVIESLQSKNQKVLVDDILNVKNYEEIKIKRFNNKTRGFIKIQDGCDNYCSYCTIPYARGHIRSRKPDDVIAEIQELSNQGVAEIVLTGINTASYGRDLKGYDFADLLGEIVNKVVNLGRIRISSIEVTEISDKLLAIIKENQNIFCNHFHIPLQSGNDNTLKSMYRKYDTTYYKDKITKIRNLFPDVNITTDVLVGFPGETEEDFNSTYNFIKSIEFGEMHVFPYSRRPMTKAYNLPNQVDEVTKHYRVNKLLQLNEELALKYRHKFLNKYVWVVVEEVRNGLARGHSDNYLNVEVKANLNANDLVKVLITDVGYPICKGVLK